MRVPLLKRIFDIVAALFAIIFLSPVLLAVALLVRIYHGAPILFGQTRAGFKGMPFRIYKFRSMTDARAADGDLLPDIQRLTSLGLFLRATSLDELPELFNVLRGEMSLVGPRPLLMEYLERYSPEQNRRHDVLPGLTGWAQVNGRNALTWEEKFTLDVWYVDNWSFWLDIKVLFMTVWIVLKREGVSQPGHATMEKFTGGHDSK